MKSNFDSCLEFVLKHEGGWSDHPKDPGGATMKGVTLATYREYLGKNASKDDLKNIPENHLKSIYQNRYWKIARCDDLEGGVDLVMFDIAVNAGPNRAALLLQRCVGAAQDGIIGPKTLGLAAGIPQSHMIIRFSEHRRMFYRSLSTFDTFGRGWLRRTDECENQALKMVEDLS